MHGPHRARQPVTGSSKEAVSHDHTMMTAVPTGPGSCLQSAGHRDRRNQVGDVPSSQVVLPVPRGER